MFSKAKYVVPRATFFVFNPLAQSFSVPILFSSRRHFASKSKAQPKKISPFLFQSKTDENNKAAKVKKEAESTEWLELNLKEDIDLESKDENGETQETQETLQQIPKTKSEGVAWIKQDSNKKIGVDTRSIQLGKVQDLSDIIDFLTQPQNMILSFRERSILYDKLVKIFSVRTLKFDTVTVQPVVHDFLAKFLASLKTSQNHKLYSTVFNAAVSKELFAFCEDFYRECLTDLLFNFPALKMQDLFPSLPSIQKFYYSVEITEEHEKQARRILEMAEDCLGTMTIQNKMRVVNLMRASKISNDKILDFMLYYVEMNFPSMRYDDMLSVTLACMGAKRITPYEIIYNLKNSFNKIHKELTPTVILKSLGAFCKLRLMYTETLYDNIFRVLGTETVIGGLTSIDCVLIINYYSKVNYRDSELLEKFINKVKGDLSPLNSIHLKILVLSLAELNYSDYTIYGTLFNKFKNLMDVIQALRKEESRDQFEEVYLKAICEYISPGSSESLSSSSVETVNA